MSRHYGRVRKLTRPARVNHSLYLKYYERDPQIGVTYINNAIEERLTVDAIGRKGPCGRCRGCGFEMVGWKKEIKRQCGVCKGSGVSPGCVVCHHPREETSATLKLIWEFDEFLENFHRADGVGETSELFADDAETTCIR